MFYKAIKNPIFCINKVDLLYSLQTFSYTAAQRSVRSIKHVTALLWKSTAISMLFILFSYHRHKFGLIQPSFDNRRPFMANTLFRDQRRNGRWKASKIGVLDFLYGCESCAWTSVSNWGKGEEVSDDAKSLDLRSLVAVVSKCGYETKGRSIRAMWGCSMSDLHRVAWFSQ